LVLSAKKEQCFALLSDHESMNKAIRFLTATRGRRGPDLTDWLSWIYLGLGVLVMFGPVAWLVLSSFKTQSALQEFPPSLLPMGQAVVSVPGYDHPLPVFSVAQADGTRARLAMVRRIGLLGQMVDPATGGPIQRVPMASAVPVREMHFAWENYVEPLRQFSFGRYLANSVFVTVVATIITLVVNAMCAFALSKYEFRGRTGIFVFILSTLMIPITVILVPAFLVVTGQLAVGGDPAAGGDPDRGVSAAAIYVDDSRRTAGCGADGPRQRVAGVLAHRAAIVGPRAGGAGDLFRGVAVERLPVAADRAESAGEFHPAAWSRVVPGRVADAVELSAGNDGGDADPGDVRVCVFAEIHNHGDCLFGDEVSVFFSEEKEAKILLSIKIKLLQQRRHQWIKVLWFLL
jgi:ABC-type glycerol-3-phosphate transport system permease component